MAYSTIVSVQQGGVNEPLMGAVSTMAATDTLSRSTMGRQFAYDFLQCNPPLVQNISDFASPALPIDAFFSNANEPANSLCLGGVPVQDFLMIAYQSSVGGQLGIFRIPSPFSGTYTPAFNGYTMPDASYVYTQIPSTAFSIISDDVRMFCGLRRGTTVRGAILVEPATLGISYPNFWEGDDSTTINFKNAQTMPDGDVALNRIVFGGSGNISGSPDNRPLMITAHPNGTEIGRQWLQLSDPDWDAVLTNQAFAGIYPCDAGWYAILSVPTVLPPSFLLFSRDWSQYWVYSLIALDSATLAAIFTDGWGNGNQEKIVMSTAFEGEGGGGDLFVFGAQGNPNLIVTNKLLSRAILPPPMPIPLPCVPCAPQLILASSPGGGIAAGTPRLVNFGGT